MCYSLFLSTNSPEDLSRNNSDLLRFQRPEATAWEYWQLLRYPERWYVGSKSGCSCTFRHLLSVELGFGEPEEWFPEEDDEVRATAELYRVIARLVDAGYRVDCLDVWEGACSSDLKEQVVDLAAVPEPAFRLLENRHFIFERKET